MRQRNYKQEYESYHSRPIQRRRRSDRNKARRLAIKLGLVRKGDRSKEVDHKIPLSRGGSNTKSNLRVVSRKENRKKHNKTLALKKR